MSKRLFWGFISVYYNPYFPCLHTLYYSEASFQLLLTSLVWPLCVTLHCSSQADLMCALSVYKEQVLKIQQPL